jgi:hypothetical protein
MAIFRSIHTSRGDPAVVCALLLLLMGALPAAARAQETAAAGTVAQSTERSVSEGFLSEPHFLGRLIDFGNRTIGDGSGMKSGLYPELSNMVTGSGWISAGPGYRYWFGDRALVDASAAYSWRSYKMAQGRFELTNLARSRLAIGSQIRWQDLTQMTFFGDGPESLASDRSEYRVRSTNVVGYSVVRPARWLSIGSRLGWLNSPDLLSTTGTYKRGNPEMRDVFPDNVAFGVPGQPDYLHGDLFVTADTRDSRSHAT